MLACILAGAAIFVCLAIFIEGDSLAGWLRWLAFLAIPFIVASCVKSDLYNNAVKEDNAERAAEWKRKTTPRVISSTPDGCTVYVFTTDRDHYFTRCGSRVNTETTWKESCGKSCSKEKSDVITTEGNK